MKNKPELVGYAPEIPEQIFRPMLELSKEARDFMDRARLLSADVGLCVDLLNKAPEDQFWRRNVVRSVFVFLEGCSYGLKTMALHLTSAYDIDFSPAELAMLKEEKYALDDKGQASTQDNNFQKFIPNLKFALKCFAKAHGLPLTLDMSQVPLKEFEQIRNRITHPKQLSDLSITDDEIKKTNATGNWFLKVVSDLMAAGTLQELPVRYPRVNPTTRWNVTKDVIVMHPDGNVYQFDTLEDANEYRDSQLVADAPLLTPLVFRTEDLRKGRLPE